MNQRQLSALKNSFLFSLVGGANMPPFSFFFNNLITFVDRFRGEEFGAGIEEWPM